MSKTKTEVKTRAAQIVGFLPIGGTLSGDDDTRVDQAWDVVHAWLKSKGLDAFPTAGGVQDELVPHMAFMMAFDLLDSYHVPDSVRISITNGNTVAKRDFPGLILPDHESLENPVDY